MAKLVGGSTNDSLTGSGKADTLDGGAGADTLRGGLGDDVYYVDNAADVVKEFSKQGSDTIRSRVDYELPSNVETLVLSGTAIRGRGNDSDNHVTGNSQSNILSGGAGADVLEGGSGSDELDGGLGRDTLTGGSGRDSFVFSSKPDATSIDRISDFKSGSDTILLDKSVFSKLDLGAVDEDAFRIGTAAKDSSDRIIYDQAKGILSYDADGSGSAKAIGFASLGAGTALKAADLVAYDPKADFTFDVTGKTYGKDAFDFVFDTFYHSVDAQFDEGGSAGPFEGGVRGSVKAEAGLRAEMHFASSTFESVGGIDVTVATSRLADVIDSKPYVVVGSVLHGAADASITGHQAADNFVDLFVGASVALSAGAYGDVNLGDLGSPGFDLDASVTANAGINAHVTADHPYEKDSDYGSFSIGVPKPVNDSDGHDTQPGAYGGTAIVATATSDSFISVNADISAMLVKLLGGVPYVGVAVKALFDVHGQEVDGGLATFGATLQMIDLDMHGDVSMKEKVVFDPRILVTARSSFGETLTGISGDKLQFTTPEGEGKITIKLSYQAEEVVTSTIYAHVGATFEAQILHAHLYEKNDVPGIPNTGVDISAYDFADEFAGTDIELATVTQTIAIAGLSTDQATTQYEKFRTTGGSGDSWSLTTHQIVATGNSAANSFVGNDYGNRIAGLDGADTLEGGNGDDALDGGAGKDLLHGGAGNDTMLGGEDNDGIYGGSGNDSIDGGDRDDLLLGDSGNDYILGGRGNDTLYGGAGNDTLNGGDGKNVLDGGAGADELDGGGQDDIFYLAEAGDTANDGYALDHDIVYTSYNFAMGFALIEKVVLTGSKDITADGYTNDNWIIGNSGDNVLWGEDGDDTLDGGAGADTLRGGNGNDTYVVDSLKDVLDLTLRSGDHDAVLSSISYTLLARVDGYMSASSLFDLTLTGTKAINGTGNEYGNLIIGNAAANVLDGAGGVDTLQGGGGNDTYIVYDGSAVIVEKIGGGTDSVTAKLGSLLVNQTLGYTLSAHLENLILVGDHIMDGTGNSAANRITGNAYANTLDGKGGADTLIGGAGDDIYVFDNKGDRAIEKAGEGTELVLSSATTTLSANIENLTLTGSARIDGAGNADANIIHGNAAANALSGGGGNDVLIGGDGADTLTGGSGQDHFVFDTAPAAGNADKITDFSPTDDQFYLSIEAFDENGTWSSLDTPYNSSTGLLYSDYFEVGKEATNYNTRILYDDTSGRIYWDADGHGPDAAVLLATVAKGTDLSYADFHFYHIG